MQEDQSLFSLQFDPLIKSHLTDAARWARFIAIAGMVLLVLMVVLSVAGMGTMSNFSTIDDSTNVDIQSTLRITMIFTSIIIGVIMFFPLYFLLRFSNNMKTAINANDQEAMSEAFLNMKRYFRYLGILFIIGLCFYGLMFVIFVIGTAAFGG